MKKLLGLIIMMITAANLNAQSIYDFDVKDIDGNDVSMSKYKDKVLLIVNVASKCGFTGQYKGLEKLYDDLKDQDFMVLGFPCNQFSNQEPGTNEEIKEFCDLTFKVEFDMFSKLDVNGDTAHPMYKYLKKQAPGAFGTEGIKWNFTKFLVDKNGKVVTRYSTMTKPENIKKDIENLL
jgi:glutathione peroxidase